MAVRISIGDTSFLSQDGESLLDCLSRNGVSVPHSCRSGVCQSCLMQVTAGPAPEAAQIGLKPTLQQQKFVLACQCKSDQDISVAFPGAAGGDLPAVIAGKDRLNHNVLRLYLKPDGDFSCEPGQYLTLINRDGVARSYSVANDPARDGHIELHIRLLKDGLMSGFIEKAGIGEPVTIRGPAGSCFYVRGDGAYPIVLAGTGTGLAPLYGVARQALAHGHTGEIRLLHGALREADLYLVAELQDLALRHPNFHYIPCVLKGEAERFYRAGNIEEITMSILPGDKSRTHLFLCGAPEFVTALKRKAFLGGVASKHIFSDAFLPTKSAPVAA